MDLEFDLCSQPSGHSDMFASTMNELVWKRIHIENLPHELLLTIIKFLDIRDIFCILNTTSRDFYRLITSNPIFRKNILKQVFKRSTGFVLPQNCDLQEDKILKALMLPSQINAPIPFYGYATNGGFDQLQEYWVDTAFIKGLWSICSKEGCTNVNIAGSTLSDSKNLYSTYLKNYNAIEDIVCNICNYIKYNYNGDRFQFNYIKRIFYNFSLDESEEIEKLYKIQCMNSNQYKVNHESMIGLLKISIDLYQKISLCKQVNLPVYERTIEDSQTLLCDKTINILTGVQISREGFFSCPVRTLMIFGSNKRIQVDKNAELDYYNDITFDAKLEQIINKKRLRVTDTNLHILRQKSTYFDDQTEFKFAVFSNQANQGCPAADDGNDMVAEDEEQDIFPIAWVQYTSSYIDYICLQFRRMNYFNCKHVAVKLIDCENKIKETDKQLSSNIDFNYIQFKGLQLKLN